MTRGRRSRYVVTLTPQDRQRLAALQRLTVTAPAGVVQRARLILLLAEGHTITDVAARVGLARIRVYKWLRRWQAEGLEGLDDKPRHGRNSVNIVFCCQPSE